MLIVTGFGLFAAAFVIFILVTLLMGVRQVPQGSMPIRSSVSAAIPRR